MSGSEREELQRLQEALIDVVMETSDEDLLAELREDGIDLDREAEVMRAELARAAGRARMLVAKARLGRRMPAWSPLMGPAANDAVVEARRLTVAARNGSDQSEADVQSAAEDLHEIARHQERDEAEQ